MEQAQEQVQPRLPSLSDELARKKSFIAKAALLLLAYWLVQFAHQYFLVSEGNVADSIIRASSLGGALLVGLALLAGPLYVLFPKINFIGYRRAFGVAGFVLIIVHSSSVIFFRFGGNVAKAYSNLNPLQNAMAFGIFAFWLLFPLALTSTDWAMRKLRLNWKRLHRTVYFSWILAVMHFLIIRPAQLQNIAGYSLVLVAALVFGLEFAAFVKKASASRSLVALAAGASVALFLLSLAYLTWPKALKVFGV